MKRTQMIAACVLMMAGLALADEPATKPAAAVSPEAKDVIGDVGAAYGKLSSAELDGTVTGRFDVGGDKKVFDQQFTSVFLRGSGFRHEMKDDLIAVGNAQKVYVYHLRDRMVSENDAGTALPDDVDGILREQNQSLAMALGGDLTAQLSKGATAIARGEDRVIDGTKCVTLTLDGDVPVTMCFDAQTHLLRQSTADYRKALAKRGADNVKTAEIVTDYTATKAGAPVDAAVFAWTPPEGARDMASAGALDSGGAANDLVEKAAPELTLKALDGQPFTLSSHKGSVVVLDFWATWCGPCRAALPHLQEIYQQKHDAGLQVFAVNQGETQGAVKGFVDQTKLAVPVVLDPDGAGGAKYKVEGIPQTVVIGKDGVIRKIFVGFDEDGVKAAIDAAMNGK